jgi:nucleotide-binding universal stress UspA family protein
MFRKVLVPLDSTELAEGILPYVSQIAKGMGARLILLSVIDPDALELPESMAARPAAFHATYVTTGTPGGVAAVTSDEPRREGGGVHPHEAGGPYVSQIFEKAEQDMKRRLAGLAKDLGEKGLTVECDVVFGRPAEEILKAAEKEGCDLIAMSTHGRNALGRGILGSVTDNVLHHTRVPALVITPERAKDYWQEGETISHVIVTLDGSEMAETVLPYVEALAKALSLNVTLARSARFDGFYSVYTDGYPYPGSVDLEARIEDEAIEYLKGVAERLTDEGLTVEWKLLRGNPAETIIDLARESSQDLIAITTHGRSGFTRWVLGSVAEKLVRASGDPVLVIPPPAETEG